MNVWTSTVTHDWRASERWDGQAYVLSQTNYFPQTEDQTGVFAVLATLATWRGTETTEADIQAAVEGEFGYRLSDFEELAQAHGFSGHWLRAEPALLEQLATPFIAHLKSGGGRFVIVRDARGGYVYAADPQRGNVLYPLNEFMADWTEQVFVFSEPPAQPAEWR